MTPLARRQLVRIKREDAATYRTWADGCAILAWRDEYTAIAARLEAEADELERAEVKELSDVH